MVKYIFAVDRWDSSAWATVVKKEFWEKNHYIDDSFDEELSKIMEGLGFVEAAESMYEHKDQLSEEEMLKVLEKVEQFEFSEELSDYIRKCGG